MPYARIDDRWDEHPKFVDLDLAAFGLMACAIVYSNRQLTDGFIPDKAVRSFGACGKGPKIAERLVAAGIWIRVDAGYEIVGFLDHNFSRAEVEAKRASDRNRKRPAKDSARNPDGRGDESDRIPRPYPPPPPNQDPKPTAATPFQDSQPRARGGS